MKGAAISSPLYGLGQAFSSHTSRVEVPPGAIVTLALDPGLRAARRRRAVEGDFDAVEEGLGLWAVGTALKGGFLDFLRNSMSQNTLTRRGLNRKTRIFERDRAIFVPSSARKA
jgi:hypothetical protein